MKYLLAWANSFNPEEVCHVFLNENSHDLGTLNAIRENAKLHHIAPQVFARMKQTSPNQALIEDVFKNYKGTCVQAETSLKLYVRPDLGKVQRNEVDPMQEYSQEIDSVKDDLESALSKINPRLAQITEQDQGQPEYPKVTFLGTGSSVPSKYRNVR